MCNISGMTIYRFDRRMQKKYTFTRPNKRTNNISEANYQTDKCRNIFVFCTSYSEKYTWGNCRICRQHINVIANTFSRIQPGIQKETFDMQCKNNSSKTDFLISVKCALHRNLEDIVPMDIQNKG